MKSKEIIGSIHELLEKANTRQLELIRKVIQSIIK